MKNLYQIHGAQILLIAFALCVFTSGYFIHENYQIRQTKISLENRLKVAALTNSDESLVQKTNIDEEKNLYLEIESLSKAYAVEITRYEPEKLQDATVAYHGQELDVKGPYNSIVELVHALEKRGHTIVSVSSYGGKIQSGRIKDPYTTLRFRYKDQQG